jgi:hypothetical protein
MTALSVKGDLAGVPPRGYVVVDEEWMAYDAVAGNQFTIRSRGHARTAARPHKAGTPVTLAQMHFHYTNCAYSVQYYPADSGGSESHVIVTVASGVVPPQSPDFGGPARMHSHIFHTVFMPTRY